MPFPHTHTCLFFRFLYTTEGFETCLFSFLLIEECFGLFTHTHAYTRTNRCTHTPRHLSVFSVCAEAWRYACVCVCMSWALSEVSEKSRGSQDPGGASARLLSSTFPQPAPIKAVPSLRRLPESSVEFRRVPQTALKSGASQASGRTDGFKYLTFFF